jgi:hypothetical protein
MIRVTWLPAAPGISTLIVRVTPVPDLLNAIGCMSASYSSSCGKSIFRHPDTTIVCQAETVAMTVIPGDYDQDMTLSPPEYLSHAIAVSIHGKFCRLAWCIKGTAQCHLTLVML